MGSRAGLRPEMRSMTPTTERLVYLALKLALIIAFVLPAVASPLPKLSGAVHLAPSVMKAAPVAKPAKPVRR